MCVVIGAENEYVATLSAYRAHNIGAIFAMERSACSDIVYAVCSKRIPGIVYNFAAIFAMEHNAYSDI